MAKHKRKIRIDRLLILFIITVLSVTFLIILLRTFVFKSLNYNYDFQRPEEISTLPRHNYDFNKLITSPHYQYEDENYSSIYGIDVSAHQKDIDWQKVKDSGVEFAYIRLGYRGYTEGGLNLDEYFNTNYEQAKSVGLKVGVYFFSQAVDKKEAMEEAFFVLEHIQDKELDLPIVYDLEDISYDESRMAHLDGQAWTDNALAFLQKIEENGYACMLYSNLYWAMEYYDLHEVLHYPLWFAQYSDYPEFPYQFTIWQYSENGTITGINEPVDLNIMFIPKE